FLIIGYFILTHKKGSSTTNQLENPSLLTKSAYVLKQDLNKGSIVTEDDVNIIDASMTTPTLDVLPIKAVLTSSLKKGDLLTPDSVVTPQDSSYFSVLSNGKSILDATKLNDFSKNNRQDKNMDRMLLLDNGLMQGDMVDIFIVREVKNNDYEPEQVINLLLSNQKVIWNDPMPQKELQTKKETSIADDTKENSTILDKELLLAMNENDLMKYLLAEKEATAIYFAKHTNNAAIPEQLDKNTIYAIKQKRVYHAYHIEQHH
ncbi:hypothetical protein L1D34_30215, partial [Vibrio mediterranei]|uniref:hypothetical protein n=1 Tax=Vibrio mediterranei TaxID=689 RepID=UPI001EFE78A9